MKIEIPDSLKEKIADYAKAAGLSVEDFLRKMIAEKVEDMDDYTMAIERLSQPVKFISHEEARRILLHSDYPSDEEIAKAIAEDPDAPPLIENAEEFKKYKPMPPLKRE